MSLTLCVLGGNARADANSSMVLDYEATAEGCPDAGRFADEVSSKLGFVPWNGQALSTLRIRIRAEGGELVGTLELPDGSSKILRDSTCAPLFSALATAASVALDSASAAAAPVQNPAQITAPASRKATVHVGTSDGGLSVSIINSRMAMVGSNGVSAVGVSWTELCVAPCTFQLEPGRHEIAISGRGPVASRKLNIVADKDTYLTAEAGSSGLYYAGWGVGLAGVTSFTYGLVKYLVPTVNFATGETESSTPAILLMVGGLAGTGLGYGMMYNSASRLDEDSAPPPPQVTARAVTYSGTF